MSTPESNSKYTQEEQVEFVKDALMLTESIQIANQKLYQIKNEMFRRQPEPPEHTYYNIPEVKPEIPKPPKANLSVNNIVSEIFSKYKLVIIIGIVVIALGLLLCLTDEVLLAVFFLLVILAIPALLVVFGLFYIKKKKELEAQLATSPEYLKSVEAAKQQAYYKQQQINKEYAEKQAAEDAEYEAALEKYNTIILPEYKRELEEWTEIQNEKIKVLVEDIKLNSETLETLYSETKILSKTYREIETLLWLYNDMSTSDHDIIYATELYDRERLRTATGNAADEAAKAVSAELANRTRELEAIITGELGEIYGAIEDGNYELAEMKKNQNSANAVSVIQRHKLNKMVKNLTK